MPGYIKKFFNFFRRNFRGLVSSHRTSSFYKLLEPFIPLPGLLRKIKAVIRSVPKNGYGTSRAYSQAVLTLKAPFLTGYLRKTIFHFYYFYWTIGNAGTTFDTFFRIYSKVDHFATSKLQEHIFSCGSSFC